MILSKISKLISGQIFWDAIGIGK